MKFSVSHYMITDNVLFPQIMPPEISWGVQICQN